MRTIKAVSAAVLISLFFAYGAVSESVSPERAFYSGNDLYEKGDFAGAAAEYEKALASGMESAGLYYNLGNAYFRSGDLGRAILNYRRARDLAPRDADINANYRFARAKVKGPEVPLRGIWSWTPLRRYSQEFNAGELMWITSGLYLLVLLAVLLAVVQRGGARFIAAAIVLALCVSANAFITWRKIAWQKKAAVVMAQQADVHYGPSDSTTVFFKVFQGMGLAAGREKEGWYKVTRADGKSGWIKEEDIEKVWQTEK